MVIKIEKLLANISKKYGDGSIQLFGDMDKVEIERVSTGLPSLDIALGGGIPEGKVIEVMGNEGSGKTSLSLQVLAEIQKK